MVLLAHRCKSSGDGMTDIEQHDSVQVFVGLDVGEGAHHGVALETAAPAPTTPNSDGAFRMNGR